MKTTVTINGEQKEFNSMLNAFKALVEAKALEGLSAKEIAYGVLPCDNIAYIYKLKREFGLADVGDEIKEKKVKVKIQKVETKKVETKKVETKKVDHGQLHHYAFQTIVDCLSVNTNIMLIGAAGSGKTTCAMNAAKHLKLNFYAMSVGAQTSKSDFMGYMNATGSYVTTHFRNAYEFGGVFLIDEIDAGNSGIMTIINAALANEVCAFPDRMVEKHEDFRCVAAANTFGKGADRMYVGRNQLDAATLDRFVKKNFDYDEKLESKLATNQEWFNIIVSIRRVIEDKKLRILATPRATFNGCKLLTTGMNYWEVLELTVLNGLTKDELEIITSGANLNSRELKHKVAC